MILTETERKEFEEIVRPVMKYLGNAKLFHPHVKIIIDNGRAELIEGVCTYVTEEYIPD